MAAGESRGGSPGLDVVVKVGGRAGGAPPSAPALRVNRGRDGTPAPGAHRPPHLGTEKGFTALPASEDSGLAKTARPRTSGRPRRTPTAPPIRTAAGRGAARAPPVRASRAWRTPPASANTAPPPIAGRSVPEAGAPGDNCTGAEAHEPERTIPREPQRSDDEGHRRSTRQQRGEVRRYRRRVHQPEHREGRIHERVHRREPVDAPCAHCQQHLRLTTPQAIVREHPARDLPTDGQGQADDRNQGTTRDDCRQRSARTRSSMARRRSAWFRSIRSARLWMSAFRSALRSPNRASARLSTAAERSSLRFSAAAIYRQSSVKPAGAEAGQSDPDADDRPDSGVTVVFSPRGHRGTAGRCHDTV